MTIIAPILRVARTVAKNLRLVLKKPSRVLAAA
jgi:hypothetical protein